MGYVNNQKNRYTLFTHVKNSSMDSVEMYDDACKSYDIKINICHSI